jgi:hypothetical protein
MTTPAEFENTTPRFDLPLLHSGQSQKEWFLNEAHALIDALLHCTLEGEAVLAPTEPAEGECWLVASEAGGEWTGRDGTVALHQAGGWNFIAPIHGMQVFDKGRGQFVLFDGEWNSAADVAEPTGGSFVDTEARTVIAELIAVLRASGVLPST